MDTLFRRTHRSRNSVNSVPSHTPAPINDLIASVPYNQLPTSHPLPVAGPSTSFSSGGGRREPGISVADVGAPSTNPSLGSDGVFNLTRRAEDSVLPPSPRPSIKSGNSSRISTITEPVTRRSVDDGGRRIIADPGGLIQYSSPGVYNDATAKGIPQQGGHIQRTSSRQHVQQLAEFGSSRHPYAASARDPDTMSIRTVSSVNSNGRDMGSVRDLGRYPSFTVDSAVSSRSHNTGNAPRAAAGPSKYSPSISSFQSNIANSRLSEEYHFPRPSDAEVDRLFQNLLDTRNIDEHPSSGPALSSRASNLSQINIAKTAANLPVDIKWQMVESDARAKHDAAKQSRRREEEMAKSGRVVKKGTAPAVQKNSPQWFLKKIMDGSINPSHFSTLGVSIRTQPKE